VDERGEFGDFNVLVVEDERPIREGIAAFLELEYGLKPTLAMNGQQALQAVAKSSPDLIITDVLMPVLDGIELVRRLKSDTATRDIPIIVVAAWQERRNLALAAGADDFVDKPFDLDDLGDKITTHLARRAEKRSSDGSLPASAA
jgi:CheY-like chemotaxis protein